MKFMEWLERFLIALTSYFIGKKSGSVGRVKLRAELDEANLKLKMKENKDAVADRYGNIPDSDIIDGAVKRGRDKMSGRK